MDEFGDSPLSLARRAGGDNRALVSLLEHGGGVGGRGSCAAQAHVTTSRLPAADEAARAEAGALEAGALEAGALVAGALVAGTLETESLKGAELKRMGNEAYARGEYKGAIHYYTAAVEHERADGEPDGEPQPLSPPP